jgi:hypothetical protein
MEGQLKKKSKIWPAVLICLILILAAGAIGFYSKNFIPQEIKTESKLQRYIYNPEITTTTSAPTTLQVSLLEGFLAGFAIKMNFSTLQRLDLIEHSISKATNLLQEAPRFIFLMGSKILTAPFDDATAAERKTNVMSVG